jgi:trigger factor
MQVQKKQTADTTVTLHMVADTEILGSVKEDVLRHLAKDHVKIQGFRKGKAPLHLVEKSVDPTLLQSEFLDQAVNRMYVDALTQEKLRPVTRPKIELKKFVPFTTLEVDAEVEVVGNVSLPDYKKIKLAQKPVKITAKDVDEVIENLLVRAAEKKDVARAAKDGDEVLIDFTGVDAKSKDPISGADGKDYPLVLGSNTFIPGFEPNLIGVKPGEDKTFTIEFPKDYGVKALQSRNVTFTVTVQKVQEVVRPKVDDAFAKTVGPFKTLDELKQNIKEQVTSERQSQTALEYQNELIEKITDKATVAIPSSLIDEELERLEQEERQNIVYRGQTWQEHLDSEGVTEEQHREQNRPAAEKRVKAGLVLSEIAQAEGIDVTDDELAMRINLLKGQYQDPQMQAELNKPENRRDIASRVLTEKTIQKLTDYATSK